MRKRSLPPSSISLVDRVIIQMTFSAHVKEFRLFSHRGAFVWLDARGSFSSARSKVVSFFRRLFLSARRIQDGLNWCTQRPNFHMKNAHSQKLINYLCFCKSKMRLPGTLLCDSHNNFLLIQYRTLRVYNKRGCKVSTGVSGIIRST